MKKSRFSFLLIVLLAIALLLFSKPISTKIESQVASFTLEDVTVDGSSRIVDEGKDFITVEKDFKADEISTTEENIASPSMWPGFSISNIKNDGQVTDRNNIISSDDLVVGTAVSQRVSCSSTTSVSYTHSHTAHNGGITEYEVAIYTIHANCNFILCNTTIVCSMRDKV